MVVQLDSTSEQFVKAQVATGNFQSPDAVVRVGLRLLQKEDEQWKDEARRKIAEGWAEAKAGKFITPEELKKSLETLKAEWRKNRGLA